MCDHLRVAGGYGRGAGIPMKDRVRVGQAPPASSGSSSECPARHCWVSVPADGGPPRPALLLGWRREGVAGPWVGHVAYVAELRPGEWAAVVEWLAVDRLTALPPA